MSDILIVDDEKDIRELISEILNDEGFSTRLSSNSVECLKQVSNAPPSLLILDIWLKDSNMDGIEILKKQQWRGNIRELKNFIQRLVVLSPDEIINEDLVKNQLNEFIDNDKEDDYSVEGLSMSVEKHLLRYFELHGSSLPPPGLYNRILKEIEYPLIALSLNSSKGNQLKASKLLGINRNTLRKKINELDINVSQTKKMM